MNKFRINLHQVLFDDPEKYRGSEYENLSEATQTEIKATQTEIEAIPSGIRDNIINEYLVKVNEVQTDLSRKDSKNKFNTIYNNLREYYGWNNATIDINNGRKIKKMNYVLAAFIYMREHNVDTIDTIFSKVFSGLEKDKRNIERFYKAYLQVRNEREKQVQDSDKHRSKVASETRRNNESLASSVEREETEAITDKELKKQLNQLAKNKKIDFPWTDNEWKCSRKEKGLACASARVFQQLLEKGTLNQMLEECRFRTNPLTKEDAEAWGSKCKINSKAKDIQKFHQAYQEYQNPQSEYQHLKNLMGFFCENNFEDLNSVRQSLTERSRKISKKELNAKKEELYNGVNKPKDWKQRASFEIIKDRLNKGSETQTNKMLTLLGDFNLDGEVNSGDVGYKTGSQFADVFRRTVATIAIENKNFNDDAAVKNLVDYANKFGLGISSTNKVEDLYKWMTDTKNGYKNTRTLQNFIKNLPIELSDVLKNGAKAGQESLDNITHVLKLNEEEEKKVMEAAQQKAKEIVLAGEGRLEEFITDKNERANLTQQLITQLPTILINNAKMQRDGLATGMEIPLDQIIKGLSAGFNVGIGKGGRPQFGLFLGRGRTANLSDRVQLSAAISGGTKLGFVPIFSESYELSYDTNKGSREKSLGATGVHAVSLGGNVSIVGTIASYGFSVGYENKKQEGIEKQAVNINKVLQKQAKNRVKSLQGAGKTLESKKNALKNSLKQEFSKASESELENATNNLLSIIQGFKIDEKSTERDFDIYAQIIADVYSEQWRNESIAGIADNKRKFSGGKVGIQFVAGFTPIPSLVAKFTRYRNARTNETELSRVARIEAKVNGTGNKIVKLESKEMGEMQVSQINEILQRYGAKTKIEYRKGDGKKPGKIIVPVSIVNGAGINVRVSQKLKGMVDQMSERHYGGETFYIFPANTTYRLLQETGGNQRSITLNIGSDKDESNDVMLSDVKKMGELYGKKELVKGKKWEYKENFEDKGPIEYNPDFMSSLFTQDVIEGLKTIDSSNRRKFSEFMRTKRDAIQSFDEMVNALKNVLGNAEKYQPIIEKLNDSGVSDSDKQLIIDRVMAISAYANVHNKSGLELNIKQRGNRYKESGDRALKGPNGQSIFDKLVDVNRDELINGLDNYESIFMPDIIGVTAFYNRNNKAKGLALTGLGATNVLGGKTQTLSERDSKEAEKWFLGGTNENGDNIPGSLSKEKSPQERNNTMRNVKEKLPNGVTLTDNNLKDLLKGKEVELAIDNTQKKIMVKIDKEFVSYLMGECANESIGMKLKISIKEQQEFDDYDEGRLYLNNSDGSSSVNVANSNRAFGISFGGRKKGEKADASTKPGEIEEDINGDGTTKPGAKDGGGTNGDGTTNPGAKEGGRTDGDGTTKPGTSGGGGGNGRND